MTTMTTTTTTTTTSEQRWQRAVMTLHGCLQIALNLPMK
jgi:hypothetical protein